MKKNILIPLDDSEKTLESIKAVINLMNKEESIITLFHVVDSNVLAPRYVGDTTIADNLSKDIFDKAEPLLEGYTVNRVSVIGSYTSVVPDILDAIEKNKIDAVFMTKTGKGFYDKYIIGSVTSRIIKRSPVPVIVIP